MKKRLDRKIIVFYHGECPDGFTGAWAAWRRLGGRADYVGLKHTDAPIVNLYGKTIYFIDIVYEKEVIEKLTRKNKVTVIDHHISRKAVTESVASHVFDLHHSAAHLVWQYFYSNLKIPKIVQYVEDMDLWNWQLPGSRAVALALELVPF